LSAIRRIAEARRRWIAAGKRGVVAHLVSVEGSHYRRPGARMLLSEDGETFGSVSGGCLDADLRRRIPPVLAGGGPVLVRYDTGSRDDIVFGLGLGCGGRIEILLTPLGGTSGHGDPLEAAGRDPEGGALATVIRSPLPEVPPGEQAFVSFGGRIEASGGFWPTLVDELPLAPGVGGVSEECGPRLFTTGDGIDVLVEPVLPPRTLFLAGSGDDLASIARLAAPLGWYVELVVPRPTAPAERRFAELLSGPILDLAEWPARATPRSAIVVATHNYLDDLEVLGVALATPVAYVGLLGSHGRVSRLRADAGDAAAASRVHGPAGLDVGAETPEEIAVSIVAEIQAVFAGRSGGKLRSRRSSIHDRATGENVASACASARKTSA